MRYRNFLQGTTQEQRTQIKKLKRIIKNQTGIDIEKVSRKREVVIARKVYFKLLTETTKLSYTTMASSVHQTHATVLHALRNFDYDYKTDVSLKELYKNVRSLYVDGININTPDALLQQNLILEETVINLKKQLDEVRNELKEARSNNIKPRNQQTKIYASSETVVAF